MFDTVASKCVLLAASLSFTSLSAQGQCLDWKDGFGPSGLEGGVGALASFDDGSGPALYAGGTIPFAGDATVNHVAKWDGSRWTALDGGISSNGNVLALAVFDDGSGAGLYAGGTFTEAGGVSSRNIAKWDGSQWSALADGVDATVRALTVYDDGSGAALYAAGNFNNAGAVSAAGIAKWNGSSWSALGGGLHGGAQSLAIFDDGTGPVLCAAGYFISAGGVSAVHVARWDGTSWSALGGGFPIDSPYIAAFDDGSGPALYVTGAKWTGEFAMRNYVSRWDGSTWTAMASASGIWPSMLATVDDGSGPALFLGGGCPGDCPNNNIAKWSGSNWTSLGTGTNNSVLAVTSFDDGNGPALFAGGVFTDAGNASAEGVARWNGSAWTGLRMNAGNGMDDAVSALATFDAGAGLELYASGNFHKAGDVYTAGTAKWNGARWANVGGYMYGSIRAMTAFDDGSGPALFAGGHFFATSTATGSVHAAGVVELSGSYWIPLGNGLGGEEVNCLAVFDDGTGAALYVGGTSTPAGGNLARRIAKWNGTAWSALGTGVSGSVDAMVVYDDGSGPALFAGGRFKTAGGVSAKNIAKWNGTTWTALAGGIGSINANSVLALAVFDDGSGPALYVGGSFTTANGVSAKNIAKWNGTNWSALGAGVSDDVLALTVFDDGGGTALYAAGGHVPAAGISTGSIAKWDGATWTPVGGDVNGFVRALAVFDDHAGGGPDLYAGGDFTRTGEHASRRIAAWLGCGPGLPFCAGDGVDPSVATHCPCGQFGARGHGCANSNEALGGALLEASGSARANTVRLECSGIPNHNLCAFVESAGSRTSGVVFGDGVSCTSGPTKFFGQQIAGEGGNAPNTVVASAPARPSGSTRHYQVVYRNPLNGFCGSARFNVSNAYRIEW